MNGRSSRDRPRLRALHLLRRRLVRAAWASSLRVTHFISDRMLKVCGQVTCARRSPVRAAPMTRVGGSCHPQYRTTQFHITRGRRVRLGVLTSGEEEARSRATVHRVPLSVPHARL